MVEVVPKAARRDHEDEVVDEISSIPGGFLYFSALLR